MNRAWRLIKSTLIVILFFGLSKATGFVRLILVGRTFGTGAEADAFIAANQLPEVFFVLLAGGALTAAFIPVYAQYLSSARARDSARLANTILTLVMLALGGVCILAALLAPLIVRHLLAPDFPPAQQALTAHLMRIILINTTLFGLSGVLSSILNAHQHFALPALAPIALDIGYLIGLFWLTPTLGIDGLAWGTVIGAVLHIAIQTPALWRFHFRYRPQLSLALPGVQEIIRLMGPRIVMLGAIQAADLFIVRLASRLPQGSVSGYFYAFGLMQLPETLFGTALALVIFPTLAELYNAGDVAGMKRAGITVLRLIWLLTIPSAAGVALLGRPLLGLIFQRGAFDVASTAVVYSALAFLSIRIISEASLEIVARLFYARHNTFTPMLAYLGWLALNIGGIYALVERMGVAGLALSSTVAFTVLALALYVMNRRELGDMGEGESLRGLGRVALATLGMSLVIYALRWVTPNDLLYLPLAAGCGVLTFTGLYLALGGRELHSLYTLARGQLALAASRAG